MDFNSYGARRGNHEVMMRGTFANIRLRNLMVPGVEGGVSIYLPTGEQMSIYDAAMRYKKDGTPLVIIAGPRVRHGFFARLGGEGHDAPRREGGDLRSFERIHRSNLIGMGVLPLQFLPGQNAQTLGLTGKETFDISGLTVGDAKNGAGVGEGAGRQDDRLRRAGPHRHAEGARVLPSRRHPAVRAPSAGGERARGLMKLAVFDLDGTITRHDTLIQFVLGYLKSRPGGSLVFCWPIPAVLLYVLRVTDRGALKGSVIALDAGGRLPSEISTRGPYSLRASPSRAGRVPGRR